jgi:hypothetical protein
MRGIVLYTCRVAAPDPARLAERKKGRAEQRGLGRLEVWWGFIARGHSAGWVLKKIPLRVG